MYQTLISQLDSLLQEERNFITNASNFSALLFNSLENLNWVGFYFMRNGNLLLGPFQGKPACINIPLGKGVCGTAALERLINVVEDVHQFPGHIACDSASNSEIVLPIIANDKVYGVLDIDSPVFNRFDDDDEENLETMLQMLIDSSDLEPLWNYYN